VTVVRALDVPPDPLAIARALVDRPGLAVLASRPQGAPRPVDARYSFVACDPAERTDEIVPDCASPPGACAWNGAPAGPLWIGVVPYEAIRGAERPAWTRRPDLRPACALTKPVWQRYRAVVRIDHATGHVAIEADDDPSAEAIARALARERPSRDQVSSCSEPRHCRRQPRFTLDVLAPEEPDSVHIERVRTALRLIAAGDLYQVNLSRRIPMVFRGDSLALFASLLEAAPAPWGFFQDLGGALVLGASPELAISARGDALRTCPIKGTRPRGQDARDDDIMASALDADPKERAELVMAVDVHRNDVGRVAAPGSVSLVSDARVLAGRTVWSRVAEVVARRAPGVGLGDIVRALLPCGSVTGAPKVRAMEVIAGLEPWRRGAYTGAFGYVARDGALELAMAIRTIQAGPPSGAEAERRAWYFAGGGIVAESDPALELEETRWKAAQLAQLGQSTTERGNAEQSV
jgi:anthranilate/para-aminobenzoate synthase component I